MTFIEQIQNIWCEEYKKSRGIEYHLQERDSKAVGLLMKKVKAKHPQKNTNEVLSMLRQFFADTLLIQDNWLKNNMTLSVVNSKINEINAHVGTIRQNRKKAFEYEKLKLEERNKPEAELFNPLSPLKSIFGEVEEIADKFTLVPKPFFKEKPMTKMEYLHRYGSARINEYQDYKKNRVKDNEYEKAQK